MTYGVSVRDFGAKGDGLSDDQEALQRALNSGAPRVVVPLGQYRLGRTLRIGSGTRLQVHPHAVLRLAEGAGTDQSIHLISNQHPETGDTEVAIEGGIWDGNNPTNPRGPDAPGSYTGVALQFHNVRGLELRNLTIQDPESYHIRLSRVRHFRVEGIRFETRHFRPNQDGVHLGGFCEDGVIRDIRALTDGAPNDDVVALNADDANGRAQNLGRVNGPIRRLRIDTLEATNCFTFLRLASVWSRIEDIDVRHIRGGCRNYLVNCDALRYCRTPLFEADHPEAQEGVGWLRNIALRDIEVHKTEEHSLDPLLMLETRMENWLVEDFRRNLDQDEYPEAPTIRLQHVLSPEVVLDGVPEADATVLGRALPPGWQQQALPAYRAGAPEFRFQGPVGTQAPLLYFGSRFRRLQVLNSVKTSWPCQEESESV